MHSGMQVLCLFVCLFYCLCLNCVDLAMYMIPKTSRKRSSFDVSEQTNKQKKNKSVDIYMFPAYIYLRLACPMPSLLTIVARMSDDHSTACSVHCHHTRCLTARTFTHHLQARLEHNDSNMRSSLGGSSSCTSSSASIPRKKIRYILLHRTDSHDLHLKAKMLSKTNKHANDLYRFT